MELDKETGTLWLSCGNFPAATQKIVKVKP